MEQMAPPPPPRVDEAGEAELHPLENPAVLENLFKIMPFEFKDFCNFRLVSHTWLKLSIGLWRQNAWITIRDQGPDEKEGSRNVRGISRQKYLDVLENDEQQLVQHPFRNYSFHKCEFDLKSMDQNGEADLIPFWRKVGPLIIEMVVHDCQFAGVEELRTVIFEATFNLKGVSLYENLFNGKRPETKTLRMDPKLIQHALPKPEQVRNHLEEFNIDLCRVHLIFDDNEEDEGEGEESGISYFPITWIELFLHFPNIQNIGRLCIGHRTAEAELLEFFESLEILRKMHGPRFLADLNILNLAQNIEHDGFSRTLVSILNRLQFPLKWLELDFDATVDEETVKQLLEHPFEYLDLTRAEAAAPFQNFPFGVKQMALIELIMNGPIAPNLRFLKECPNLEHVAYGYGSPVEADFIEVLRDGNPSKLIDFHLTAYQCSSAEEIRIIREFMPNLEGLTIGLNNSSFGVVCEVFKDLTQLIITPFEVGEEALLGKWERSGKKFRRLNLTDLQKLKRFSMGGIEDMVDRHGLTEAGILEGILALPDLEEVERLCISSEVTAKVRKQIEMKFPECKIYTPEVGEEEEQEEEGDQEESENAYAVLAAQFQQNRADDL